MIVDLYDAHPLWVWLAIGGVLLAAELATGSGWLLWPAACAAVVALVSLTGLDIGFWGDVALFSILTIVTTVLARKYTPSWTRPEGRDINDRSGELVGQVGEAVTAFSGGSGRVLVSGAEWHAELDGEADVPAGSKVKVLRVLDGARIRVGPV